MNTPENQLVVTQLPRAPFLDHSEMLLKFLLTRWQPSEHPRILELGCGPRSPLVPMLKRLLPSGYRLDQIDARPEVIAEAQQFNPDGRVARAMAHNLTSVADESMDLVIAMSVFDQNPAHAMSQIGSELLRVLKQGGLVITIHNEELNAPATYASFLNQPEPEYLLPSDHWHPLNDIEYCIGPKLELDAAIAGCISPTDAIREYVTALMPPTKSGPGVKIQVPLVSRLTPEGMQRVRQQVAGLRKHTQARLSDCSTARLLANHIEGQLFSARNGFQVLDSGVFEIQKSGLWNSFFREPPREVSFARGITKFGVASSQRIPPNPAYRQDVNDNPKLNFDGALLLTAYQYGLVACKNRNA